MSMSEVERQRYARQRGDIIRVLYEDYTANMTSVDSVIGTLDAMGTALAPETLDFHLVYLADSGYIRLWRTRDMPGWRSDRINRGNPEEIRFAKLLPLGLQLLDGITDANPGVKF